MELEVQNLNDVEVGSDECASWVHRRIVHVIGMVEVVLIIGCVVVVVVVGTSQPVVSLSIAVLIWARASLVDDVEEASVTWVPSIGAESDG